MVGLLSLPLAFSADTGRQRLNTDDNENGSKALTLDPSRTAENNVPDSDCDWNDTERAGNYFGSFVTIYPIKSYGRKS